MLGAQKMMAIMLIFVICTILSHIGDGIWLMINDKSIANNLTSWTTYDISFFTFPLVLVDFFTKGIPYMLSWNYSFLQNSGGGIIRWILGCTVSLAFAWTIIQLTLPIIANAAVAIAGGVIGVFRRF